MYRTQTAATTLPFRSKGGGGWRKEKEQTRLSCQSSNLFSRPPSFFSLHTSAAFLLSSHHPSEARLLGQLAPTVCAAADDDGDDETTTKTSGCAMKNSRAWTVRKIRRHQRNTGEADLDRLARIGPQQRNYEDETFGIIAGM